MNRVRKKYFLWFSIWMTGLLLGYGWTVHAEPTRDSGQVVLDNKDVVQTDVVVVTATKTPHPIREVTSAVEVITGEDLAKRSLPSVVDALQFAQGLAVFSNGGPGTTATVRMRGANDTQTLVVVDGAILNNATLGSYNFANLTSDNIDRIEILRGPQSMLWGSDAMGGVINIRTKRGRGPFSVSGFLEYGSFLTLREGGSISGTADPMDFSVSLSRTDIAGFSATNYRRGAGERDAFRNWQFSSLVGFSMPHEGRLQLVVRWLDGKKDIDNISTPTDVYGR